MAGKGTLTVQLEGVDKLKSRFNAMPDRIARSVLRKQLRAIAGKVARKVRAATPRHTGLAAHSVRIKTKVRDKVAWARVYYKGKPGFYIRVFDQGALKSGRQRARPFFEQAVAGWEQDATGDLTDGLREAVEKAEAKV